MAPRARRRRRTTPCSSSIAPTVGVRPPPMRQSVPSAGDVTQAASCRPRSTRPTRRGTRVRTIGFAVRSSRRATEPSTPSTQTPASPAATAAARDRSRRRRDRARRRVDADDGEVRRHRPDGATAHGEVVVDEVREDARSVAGGGVSRPLRSGRRRRAAATAVATGPTNCGFRSGRPFATQAEPGADGDVGRRRAGGEGLDDTRRLGRAGAPSARPRRRPRRRRRVRRSRRACGPLECVAVRRRSTRRARRSGPRPGPARERASRRRRRARAQRRPRLRRGATSRTTAAAASRPAPRRPRGVQRAGAARLASWARIACWSRCSSGPGSRPSSCDQHAAASAYTSSASACRPAAVEGEHELRAEALAERLRANERVELSDELGVRARTRGRRRCAPREPRAAPPPAADGVARESLSREVGKRRPAPQREAARKCAAASSGRASSSSPCALARDRLEPVEVELPRGRSPGGSPARA